jgi:putative copper export protein
MLPNQTMRDRYIDPRKEETKMNINILVPTLIVFLHDLFTVVWIGGLAFMVLVMIPALKGSGQKENLLQVSKPVMARFRKFVVVSIVVLFATGLFLSKRSPHAGGFMQFTSPYTIALSIKHILMILMLLIVVFKKVLSKKMKGLSMFGITLVNFILGTLILFLSAMTSAISSAPKP